MTRILHVTDAYLPQLGGIEIHVDDLVRRQRAQGHDVEIVTSTRPCLEHPHGNGRDALDPEWVRRLGGTARTGLGRSLAAARDISDLKMSDYDVVHAHASVLSPLAMAAARAASSQAVPTAVTVHSLWSRLGPLPSLAESVVQMRTWPVAWSSVSSVAARSVSQTLGPAVPVRSIANGIDPELWRPAVPPPQGELTIVAVMRLARRKRPLPLLRMLRRLRRIAPADLSFRVLIVGDGPEQASMERFLADHRMDDWVSLTGRLERDRIRDVFSRSHLFVAPAELESFGIAALEARCAGLPVVASARGGVGEFVEDGVDGLLAWSDGDMVQAMLTLLTQHAVRRRMTLHNRTVTPCATWSAVLGATDDLYRQAQALSGGRSTSRGRVFV